MENLGILYYESMIELEIENQRINEAIMTPKFARYFTESDEDISVHEAKVVSSVLKFISDIFGKVVKFFQDMIAFITKKDRDDSFKPNPKLIAACEQKIKSITDKEKKEFKLEKISFTDTIIANTQYIEQMTMDIVNKLNKLMQFFDDAVERKNVDVNKLKDINDAVESYKDQLKDRSDINNNKKSGKDVTYNDIADILSDYKESENILNDFKETIKNISGKMEKYKKQVDDLVKTLSSEDQSSQNISNYKNVIYSSTAFITNATRNMLNLYTYDYRYQEIILKKFVSYKISESYTNFDGESVIEALIYEEYERGVELCLN